jgi:Co/Zn/Cd efflux system component
MSHSHTDGLGHHHAGHARERNRRRLFGVLFLVLGYAVIELVGGFLTGSLALLADALHMVADVAALALSALAVWMASRPAPWPMASPSPWSPSSSRSMPSSVFSHRKRSPEAV